MALIDSYITKVGIEDIAPTLKIVYKVLGTRNTHTANTNPLDGLVLVVLAFIDELYQHTFILNSYPILVTLSLPVESYTHLAAR